MAFAQKAEIYAEEAPAVYLYTVASGAVRTYKLFSDGRRQIGAFYLPGDVFGIEAGANHRFSAEAITHSTITVVKRSMIEALAARDSELAHRLWLIMARHLERAEEHSLLLGRKNAHERIAIFLMDMLQRHAMTQDAVELPMSRQDIADYLGLTIETVSRTLTEMAHSATIDLPSRSRRILLRNRAALARLCA
jgi:CRP/FNR family nitrogen fixation transcriptional regulator